MVFCSYPGGVLSQKLEVPSERFLEPSETVVILALVLPRTVIAGCCPPPAKLLVGCHPQPPFWSPREVVYLFPIPLKVL